MRATEGEPTIPVDSAAPVPTKRSVCEEILASGYVQSFVDFFYLTHRQDPKATAGIVAGAASSKDNNDIVVSAEEMKFMKENLTRAEESRRKGDTDNVYNSYSNLAVYFQRGQVNDPKTGVYFYEKCLEIAKLTSDGPGEMSANHSLGCVHQQMGNSAAAIRFHERHMELARASGSYREMEGAARELVKVSC